MTKTITSFPISWHSAFLQSTLIAEQSKLETIKTMGARSKINAISLNVKINERKSVHIRGYILPINVQNFMQKDWAQAKISMKLVGVYFFDSPCISNYLICVTNKLQEISFCQFLYFFRMDLYSHHIYWLNKCNNIDDDDYIIIKIIKNHSNTAASIWSIFFSNWFKHNKKTPWQTSAFFSPFLTANI